MIGNMIQKAREEQGMTKTELARLTNINIGHLTHIEKGERNPSHKALKNICKALSIPYQQLMYTYDKELNEEQENYNYVQHVSYNKVLAVDSISSFIDCPANIPSASLAIRMNDNSMEPVLKIGTYLFVEFNSPLNNKDIGIFDVNGKIVVRKFYSKKDKIILKAEDRSLEDIVLDKQTPFYIIGKVLIK